jgi:hypothetical protein
MARIKRLGRIKAQKLDSKALSTTPFYERPTRQKKLDEKQLYLLAQSLLPIESIARIMSCNPDLIYTRYADLLQKGRDDRKHSLVQAMWHQALYEKDTKMMIWLSKQHLGYRDVMPEEATQISFNVFANEVPK